MVRKFLPASIALMAVLAAFSLGVASVEAGGHHAAGQALVGHYAQPAVAYGAPHVYLAPRPTPPVVGHTYVTYQPLAPHQFLYPHHRIYKTHNPCSGGCKCTFVSYSHCFDWRNLLCPPKVIYPNHCCKKWTPGF